MDRSYMLYVFCFMQESVSCLQTHTTTTKTDILSSSLLFGRQAIRGRGHTVQQRNNLRLQSKESSQVRIKTSKVCTWDIDRIFFCTKLCCLLVLFNLRPFFRLFVLHVVMLCMRVVFCSLHFTMFLWELTSNYDHGEGVIIIWPRGLVSLSTQARQGSTLYEHILSL